MGKRGRRGHQAAVLTKRFGTSQIATNHHETNEKVRVVNVEQASVSSYVVNQSFTSDDFPPLAPSVEATKPLIPWNITRDNFKDEIYNDEFPDTTLEKMSKRELKDAKMGRNP